jgi:hypothetical protein
MYVDSVREVRFAEAIRPAHVARIPFAANEVELDGVTMPLFEPAQWLAALHGAAA